MGTSLLHEVRVTQVLVEDLVDTQGCPAGQHDGGADAHHSGDEHDLGGVLLDVENLTTHLRGECVADGFEVHVNIFLLVFEVECRRRAGLHFRLVNDEVIKTLALDQQVTRRDGFLKSHHKDSERENCVSRTSHQRSHLRNGPDRNMRIDGGGRPVLVRESQRDRHNCYSSNLVTSECSSGGRNETSVTRSGSSFLSLCSTRFLETIIASPIQSPSGIST